MSFFNNLKRALGFNGEGEDMDDEGNYTPYSNPFHRDDDQDQDSDGKRPAQLGDEQVDERAHNGDAEEYVVPARPASERERDKKKDVKRLVVIPEPTSRSGNSRPRIMETALPKKPRHGQPHGVKFPDDEPQQEQQEVQHNIARVETIVQQPEKAEPVLQQPVMPQEGTVLITDLEPKAETATTPAAEAATAPASTEAPATIDNSSLIDTVVGLINAALPPMMQQYINADTQRSDVEKALAPHLTGTKPAGDGSTAAPATNNAETEKANKELQDKLDECTKVLEENKATMLQLNEKLAQATATIESLKAQAVRDNEQITTLTEQLAEANANLAIAAQIEERINEMEAYKNRTKLETKALKERIAQLESRDIDVSDELRAQLQLAQEQNAKLNKDIERLNRSARETHDKHNRRDVELANRINDLKSQVQSAARLAESYKDSLDEQIKAADEARAHLDKARKQHDETRERLNRAKDETRQARNEARETKSRLEELEKDLKDKQQQAAQAARDLEQAREELQAAHILNDDLQEQLDEAGKNSDKIAQAEKERDKALRQLGVANMEHSGAKDKVNALEAQVKELKKKLDEKDKQLATAAQGLEDEKRNRQELQDKFDELKHSSTASTPAAEHEAAKNVVLTFEPDPADTPAEDTPATGHKPETEPRPNGRKNKKKHRKNKPQQPQAKTIDLLPEASEGSHEDKPAEPLLQTPVLEETPAKQDDDMFGKALGITLDDIDDVDWLIPVEPDPIPGPEPEPEPEPAPEPKPKVDPRQLSLW